MYEFDVPRETPLFPSLRRAGAAHGSRWCCGAVFHADRYRGRIQIRLSAALGRAVTVGKVRLDLFTGPGFSVET